jgi:hypothetical protein
MTSISTTSAESSRLDRLVAAGRERVRPLPLAVRGAIVVAGVLGLVATGAPHPLPVLVTVLGVLLAAGAPARFGSWLAVAGLVIAWLAATGWHGAPADWRIVAAALALYVVHTATGLAAFLPLGATAEPVVVMRWARRCGLPVALAAVVVAVDLALPRHTGSPLFELGGLAGAVLVVGVATRRLWLPGRAGDDDATSGRAPHPSGLPGP